ncbi:MAG: hypothetical protein WBQ58_09235 [Methanoregula sp.]
MIFTDILGCSGNEAFCVPARTGLFGTGKMMVFVTLFLLFVNDDRR